MFDTNTASMGTAEGEKAVSCEFGAFWKCGKSAMGAETHLGLEDGVELRVMSLARNY